MSEVALLRVCFNGAYMYRVQFIEVEDEVPDLILSFALDVGGPAVKSLVILRTPSYEAFMPEDCWGTKVSMEDDDYLERDLLLEVSISKGCVIISTQKKSYELDISRIEQDELDDMLSLIEKLNFDSSFKVSNAL